MSAKLPKVRTPSAPFADKDKRIDSNVAALGRPEQAVD
jgi:hypothetical protein